MEVLKEESDPNEISKEREKEKEKDFIFHTPKQKFENY